MGTPSGPGRGDSPWRALPPRFAQFARAENPRLAAEIVREIKHTIPAFALPPDGGVLMALGTTAALDLFTGRVADENTPAEPSLRVHRSMGRGVWGLGRGIDALQAGYRVGTRLAWRRYAPLARQAGLPDSTLTVLADAIFAHVEEMTAASVTGYREAADGSSTGVLRARLRLLDMLATGVGRDHLLDAAHQARWPVPERVTAVVPLRRPRPQSPLPNGVLARLDGPAPFLFLPDPASQVLTGQLAAVLGPLVIGPAMPLPESEQSLRWARAVAARTPAHGTTRVVRCEEDLSSVLLMGSEALVHLLAERRLAPLADLTPGRRARLERTLLAWLSTPGSVPDVADQVGLHPQTVRQHLKQLNRLFGPDLYDPRTRFELQIALRGRLLAEEEQEEEKARRAAPAAPARNQS